MQFVLVAAAALLALNIGANNSATEMGAAYGADVRTRRQAVVLIAVFTTLGAVLASGRVVHTIAHGLLAPGALSGQSGVALVIVLTAGALVVLANVWRIPTSTTQAVVGAVVGIGLAFGEVNWRRVAEVVGWWAATPAVAFGLSFLVSRYAYQPILEWLAGLRSEARIRRLLGWSVTLSGSYLAFSAGANNLANSVGPVVAAGAVSAPVAAAAGGVAMALGALVLGGRMLETVGKELTRICVVTAVLVMFICASIILAASRFGMPVSLAQVVTASVVGFGTASCGLAETSNNVHVRKMSVLWPLAPGAAALASYSLVAVLGLRL